jgi:hypothetical protein
MTSRVETYTRPQEKPSCTGSSSPRALPKTEKGAPKKNLEPVWAQHLKRRASGAAHLSPTHEAAALKDWLHETCGGDALPGRKTIYTRLLTRYGSPHKKKGAGYTRNLIAEYRANGLQDAALATYDTTLEV